MRLPNFDLGGVRSTRSVTTPSKRALVDLVEQRFPHGADQCQGDLAHGRRRNFVDYSGPPCTECESETYEAQITSDRITASCTSCGSEYSRTVTERTKQTGRYKMDVTRSTVWLQRSPELARQRWIAAHPAPHGASFYGYCAFGPMGSTVSGPDYSIAQVWPPEHRLYRLMATHRVAFAPTQKFCGWLLRSPIEGIDVRQLLFEIKRRRTAGSKEPMESVVANVLADAARGVEMKDAEGHLGECWLAVFDPTTEHSRWKISSRCDPTKETLDIDIIIGDELHQIAHTRDGNRALNHRNLKTSRGVSQETCAACHEVLRGLEAFRDASPHEIQSWIESGIDLRAAAEWHPFATPKQRAEWIKVGFDRPTAAAWAPTCGPAEALIRAESDIQPN